MAFEIGKPEQKDDGMFFMAWEDFEHRFDWVGVIFPGVGIENLHITINESNKVLVDQYVCDLKRSEFPCIVCCFRCAEHCAAVLAAAAGFGAVAVAFTGKFADNDYLSTSLSNAVI